MIGCPLENHPGHKNRDTPEPLVIAAQDLMFSMLGPDDGKWKQLKEPFNATYAKSFARPLPYFI